MKDSRIAYSSMGFPVDDGTPFFIDQYLILWDNSFY